MINHKNCPHTHQVPDMPEILDLAYYTIKELLGSLTPRAFQARFVDIKWQ
jgi:hypothetical protein